MYHAQCQHIVQESKCLHPQSMAQNIGARKLLGFKTLGLNVLEFNYVMLANHDQNIQSCFRLAKSVFMCKVGIDCTIGCVNLQGSIDRKLDLIDRSSCRLFFCRIFQLSPSPYDMQGFMFCLKYKRKNPSHVLLLLFMVFV